MKKVLVVEDDQFLAAAYKLKLTKSGFEVMVASDGGEALAILREFIPDVVILDLIMPNVDGFTCLSRMKSDEKLKNIPVIVASNLGQKEDVEKAKNLGAAEFIIKSNVSIDDILEKINSILNA